jgi:hypothetical protein
MKASFKKIGTIAALLVGTAVVVTSFQNCGVAGFETIGSLEKQNLIQRTSVFGNQYVMVQPNSNIDKDTVNTVVVVSNDNTGVDVPVTYFCTTMGYTDHPRAVDLSTLYAEVTRGGAVVCDDKINQRSDIMDYKKFKVPNSCLAKLTAGQNYAVRLYTPTHPSLKMGAANSGFTTVSEAFHYDGKNLKMNSGSFTVLYDKNPALTSTVTHKNCDQAASPLVALIGEGSHRIELTPPSQGIRFDILGRRATPAPFAKRKISWFLNDNHNYYFIALPNSAGQVRGIDELFGDNTYGPDGKFASNGYAALAKFDANNDSYITAKDPVFSKLRLWHDSNLDGVSSSDELFTMDEMGVVSIDLKYDQSYKETDIYGNEILMKSAIKTQDGQLHLLFDLWFRHFN